MAAVQGLLREPVFQYLCDALYNAQVSDVLLKQLLTSPLPISWQVPLGVPLPATVGGAKRPPSATSSLDSDASTISYTSSKRRRVEDVPPRASSRQELVGAAATLQLISRR